MYSRRNRSFLPLVHAVSKIRRLYIASESIDLLHFSNSYSSLLLFPHFVSHILCYSPNTPSLPPSLAHSHLLSPPFSFKGVLQVDPADTKAMSSLALAYVDKGDTEEAIHWFRRTVEVDSTSRAPLYNLAVILSRNKRQAEAVPLLNQLLTVSACLVLVVYIVVSIACTSAHVSVCVQWMYSTGKGGYMYVVMAYVHICSVCSLYITA